MDDYESITCVKNEVFVYKIPARSSNRGYKAADWKLDAPDWTGRLKVVAKGKNCLIRLDDKISGELFAECPVDGYPGVAVEQVMDSSRYFVIRIQDPTGRHAFIGIGFADRGDSFDLIVALQDHFKQMKREETAAKDSAALNSGPKLDLGFKEGQTIKININTKKNENDEDGIRKSRPRAAGGGGGILLPPPPGGVKIPPPRQAQVPPPSTATSAMGAGLFSSPAPAAPPPASTSTGSSNLDLLLDFGTTPQPAAPSQPQPPSDPWGDFASASFGSSSTTSNTSAAQSNSGWVNFN